MADVVKPSLLNISEACEILDLTYRTVSQYARSGTLPAHKIGGGWYFAAADIEAYLHGEKPMKQDEAAALMLAVYMEDLAPGLRELQGLITEPGAARRLIEIMHDVDKMEIIARLMLPPEIVKTYHKEDPDGWQA